mgnify:CR=1 FL=1
MYWIPKLHKKPYKERFISNSRSCTTTKLSILLTSCLAKIKDHVELYCDKTYENSGINMFWSIKNSTEVLSKLQNKRYFASTISTYDFSTLYTTLPHNLIKEKYSKFIQKTFAREKRIVLARNVDHEQIVKSSRNVKYFRWFSKLMWNLDVSLKDKKIFILETVTTQIADPNPRRSSPIKVHRCLH